MMSTTMVTTTTKNDDNYNVCNAFGSSNAYDNDNDYGFEGDDDDNDDNDVDGDDNDDNDDGVDGDDECKRRENCSWIKYLALTTALSDYFVALKFLKLSVSVPEGYELGQCTHVLLNVQVL